MKKCLPLVFLLFFIFGIEDLKGQEIEILRADTLASNFFNNKEYDKSKEVLEQAITLLGKNKNWDLYAQYIAKISKTHHVLSEFDEIIRWARSGREKISADIGKNNTPYAILLIVPEIAYSSKGMIDTTHNFLIEATEILTKLNGRKDKWALKAFGALGNVLRNKGSFEEAKLIFEENIQIVESKFGLNSPELIQQYGNLAMTLRDNGEPEKALKPNFKVMEILIKNFGEGFPMLGYAYQQIGFCYLYSDDLANAELFFQKSIDQHLETIGVPNGQLGEKYINLGLAQYRKNELVKAKKTIRKGVKVIETHIGKGYFQLVNATNNLGGIFIDTNQPDSAKAYFQKTIQIAKWNNRTKHSTVSEAYMGIANSEALLNNYETALHSIQKGIINECTEFFDTLTYQNPVQEQLSSNWIIFELFDKKASILSGLSKINGDKELLLQAKETVDFALLVYDSNQAVFSMAASEKNKFSSRVLNLIYTGIQIADELYKKSKKESYLEYTFNLVEKMKGLSLVEAFDETTAKSRAGISKEINSEEKQLGRKIFRLEQQLQEAIDKNDNLLASSIRGNSLFLARQKQKQLIEIIEKKYPKYFDLKYQRSFSSFKEIANILEQNAIVIEYALIKNQFLVITLSKNQPLQIKRIPLDETTSQRIEDFNRHLQKSTLSRNTSREKFIRESHELYKQFLQPIEDQLIGKDRIIIIGDGMTNYIPFEVLLKSDEVKPFKELDFLVKNHEVSYHYSATLFAKAKEKEFTENQGIYAFAPVYEQNATDGLAARRELTRDTTLRAYNADGTFSPLPESEREVKSIIKLFEKSGSKDNLLALKKDATESSLKTNLEKPYKYIHIAGHSFADLKNPKFSGIACYDQAKSTEGKDSSAVTEDGTLYTGEIYNIASKADLVTLSSCESGFGKLEKTEGLLGLNRAFIYAGAPNVVFSLWKVYDKVSATMMTDFYKNVLDGKTYSASLREAKLELLKKEETASPHFWSPFLLIGR